VAGRKPGLVSIVLALPLLPRIRFRSASPAFIADAPISSIVAIGGGIFMGGGNGGGGFGFPPPPKPI